MGGGLMQLVAYGAQDIYLTGNPQITFFKVVYRRHTNFSMECIDQSLSGNVGANNTVTATIARNGDLISRMYYEIDARQAVRGPNVGGTAFDANDNNYGTQVLDNVELEIGGQRIDRHSGHWMETWFQLTQDNPTGLSNTHTTDMAQGANGNTFTKFQKMACAGGVQGNNQDPGLFWVPLQFWFCRNPGLALPLIALQYHEVKVKLTFSGALLETAARLWVDYIYLDTDERRRFAQQSHEYLIEQVQEQNGNDNATSQELTFNHPVKELVWTGAYANAGNAGTDGQVQSHANLAATTLFTLKLNGHERFQPRPMLYFTRTQVWAHHSGYGGVDGNQTDSIAVYSFALKPEEHQPSGTCNFSRIDNASLQNTAGNQVPCPSTGKIFAVNYNVLRIMSGMGGLAYSN